MNRVAEQYQDRTQVATCYLTREYCESETLRLVAPLDAPELIPAGSFYRGDIYRGESLVFRPGIGA